MVSQRRLFNLLTLLILISLFVVACERPLTGSGDTADQTGEVDDADVGGGVGADEDTVNLPAGDTTEGATDSGGTADSTTDDGTADDSATDGQEGDTIDDGADAAADTDDGSQDDSEEAGGGVGEDAAADESQDDSAEAGGGAGEDGQAADDAAASDDSTADNSAEDAEEGDGEISIDIPATHTVAAGENLYRIGLKYGVSWVALANENGLANPNVLSVGQVLKLPGATPPPTTTPTPSPQTETTYIVKAGDNLFRIGVRFGINWIQIAEANGLVNPNLIKVGDELKIPVNTPGPAPEFSHVVKQGETLFLISLQYGVKWPAIAEANGLTSPYVIYVGQTLEIPGSQ